ncbi:MAG: DEAD/DEAH box helicase [Microbacteriaceae bacterium]|nr:DEAD/DEAH box helicase [Microbacteriaceae bacterium]
MNGPLIVQSDRTVLLEVGHEHATEARHALAVFAELERAPEHIHTYRITRLGLWNARAAGHTADEMLETLETYSKFPVPPVVAIDIADTVSRYGRIVVERDTDGLYLEAESPEILAEVTRTSKLEPLLGAITSPTVVRLNDWARGIVKQELLGIGWPAEDRAGFTEGTPMTVALDNSTWELRGYQREAIDLFDKSGAGVVVLPCGAGKTVVGIGAMVEGQSSTLILVTNSVSARQWRDEIIARTTLSAEDIGEYSGEKKEIKAVTIATYHILTAKRAGAFAHLPLLDANNWGLIIYDEVHLLPAPVFKLTADLQARRRLGLTATLVREDGKEGDVFSLIGPKRFDAPWKEIEAQGFIAPARCVEVRVLLESDERMEYAVATERQRFRIAATSPAKRPIISKLIAQHPDDQILVIAQYLDQIDDVSDSLGLPTITGATPVDEREVLYDKFRTGEIRVLLVSKVANFSVDLPDASVAIQISGSFGSRQEEAQRLGRILRPKSDGRSAVFYTVVARDTVEQDFAQNRQRFLTEQGYAYEIVDEGAI